jgi:hypothetical protein
MEYELHSLRVKGSLRCRQGERCHIPEKNDFGCKTDIIAETPEISQVKISPRVSDKAYMDCHAGCLWLKVIWLNAE